MMNGYEKAADEVIPAARILIARQLRAKYNLTESNIARILGVAQAAVSKYLNGECSDAVEAATKEVDGSVINSHIASIASGDQKMLKQCICTLCNSMNKFDCKFSYMKGATTSRV